MRWTAILEGIMYTVLAAIILSLGTYILSFVSAGGLGHVLGLVTASEFKEYAEQHKTIRADDLRLEVSVGKWNTQSTKNDDGSVVAYADSESCPKNSVMVAAYCGIVDERSNGAVGNIQRVGLGSDNIFRCTWNEIKKPDTFKVGVQAMCLSITNK
jgi:hypothetical protein